MIFMKNRPFLFLYPGSVQTVTKSNSREDPKITIRASTEKIDRHNERVLKSAFADKDNVSDFVKEGFYDYNHVTDFLEKDIRQSSGTELAQLHEERLKAIVGFPERNDKGLYTLTDGVYSEGTLLGKSQYGKYILDLLKSGFGSVGASIAGTVRNEDIKDGVITKFKLKKIALQPVLDSVNNDTIVRLKSQYGGIITPDMNPAGVKEVIEHEKHEAEEMDKLEEILCKVNFLFNYITALPEFQEHLIADLQGQLKQTPDYSNLKEYVIGKYPFSQEEASEVVDLVLSNYKTR